MACVKKCTIVNIVKKTGKKVPYDARILNH